MPTEAIVRAHQELPADVQERWSAEDVQTIAATVCDGLSAGQLKMVLMIGAKYGLDPLLREIWGARGKNQDGSPGRLLIMVGRDGLLKNANRHREYAGFDWGEVRANDHFKVTRSSEGGHRTIEHSYEGGAEKRGELVGAWAEVYRMGHHPVFYFANWSEYAPESPNKRSSWSTSPTVMILKCALSHALRVAFSITGVVGEEEAYHATHDDEVQRSVMNIDDVVADLPSDLANGLVEAYAEAEDLRPGEMPSASVELNVAGQEREAIEAYLAREISANEKAREQREAQAPPEAEVVEDEATSVGQ